MSDNELRQQTQEAALLFLKARLEEKNRNRKNLTDSLDGIVDKDQVDRIEQSYKREIYMLLYLQALVVDDI